LEKQKAVICFILEQWWAINKRRISSRGEKWPFNCTSFVPLWWSCV